MDRHRWFAGLLVAAVSMSAAAPCVAGTQTEPFAPPHDANDAPRYFEPGSNTLHSTTTGPATSDVPPAAQRYAEQTVAATDVVVDAAHGASPISTQSRAGGQQPLLLPPPSDDAPAEQRARLSEPLMTGAASLGIVLGLFLLVVLVLRRGGARGSVSLPADVVEVLGRATLAGRQQAHLVRCANKLLLVSISPTSVQTLTEITDPEEVRQLLAACGRATHDHLAPGAEETVRPHSGRFAARDEGEIDFSRLEAVHHGSRGVGV